MLFCQLTISSKNKQSLNNFIQICLKNKKLNFNIVTKSFKDKTYKKIVTILKSPHINKTAQEQFEERIFIKQVKIITTKTYSFLIFLKKIADNLLTDVRIKVNFNTQSGLNKSIKNNSIYNLDNFKINFYKRKLKNATFLSKKKLYLTAYNSKKDLKNTGDILKSLETYGKCRVESINI